MPLDGGEGNGSPFLTSEVCLYNKLCGLIYDHSDDRILKGVCIIKKQWVQG